MRWPIAAIPPRMCLLYIQSVGLYLSMCRPLRRRRRRPANDN